MENLYRRYLIRLTGADAAHDIAHTERVVSNAKKLLTKESADEEIVIAAAWLHDCVNLPKDHPDRDKSSAYAAENAANFLESVDFDKNKIEAVSHAIETHSFSSKKKPETVEAKIVQDADRLDALGAIGVARSFIVAGNMNRPIYDSNDPFCNKRTPDDSKWTIDHFYTKLFKLPELMNTDSAKEEAKKRVEFMYHFIEVLSEEI